jgi:hypothetical protein
MNIRLRNKFGGALLAFSLLFVITLAASNTAQAQYPYGRNGQYGRDGDWRDRQARRDRDRDRDGRYRDRNRDRNRDYRYENRRDDQYSSNGRYGNYGGYNANRVELSQGYQAGINTGASDAQRGQSYNPQRSHYYRNANTQVFREGFVRGYNEGYRQYQGYGNDRYRRNNGVGNILGGIFGRP